MGNQLKCFAGFAWAFLTLVTTPLYAQTHAVTIAWDASPDPNVVGYVVYVRTDAGAPAERFEVSGTSFVYQSASEGQPYFFSVAAYSAGPRVGSASDEVMFLGGSRRVVASAPARAAAATAATGDERRPSAAIHAASPSPMIDGATPQQRLCVGEGEQHCYVPAGSLGPFGEIDSLRAIGDGRLVFIEGGSRIVIEDPIRNTATTAAAVSGEGARIASVAVDPQFTSTHFVFAAETESSGDGTTRLSVVRYRESEGRLGERAVVVPELPVADDNIRLVIDGAQHLFVAVPGGLLRYVTDGSVPSDNRAMSPVYAEGVTVPAAIAWDLTDNSLWLAGAQSSALRRLRLDLESRDWPRPLDVVNVASDAGGIDLNVRAISFASERAQTFFVAGEPAGLFTVGTDTQGALRMIPVRSDLLDGEPTAAVLNQGELDVAIRGADATTRIVRFRQLSTVR